MVRTRMAAAPRVYILCFLTTLARAVCASLRLTEQVSSFIPTCAQPCFISFVEVNYGGLGCGDRPSLQCLCSTRGNTEFTLGEGAAQCLSAEKQFGSCADDEDFDGSDVNAAYFMCLNVPQAIRPTHSVITASVLLPTSAGGVVKFPALSTTSTKSEPPTTFATVTSTSTTSDSSTTTTGPTTTTTRPRPPPSTTATTLTTRTSTTSSSTSDTEANVPPPPTKTPVGGDATDDNDDKGDDDASPSLDKGQVAGISVGVVSAAGLAVLAIVLARYCRRRRDPNLRSSFLPRRSTWGFGRFSTSVDPSPHRGPNPHFLIPDQPLPPPPPAYSSSSNHNRTSWKPDLIGVALSPTGRRDLRPTSPVRRISKLLPAKPVLPRLLASEAGSSGESLRNNPPTQPLSQSPPRLPRLTGISEPLNNSTSRSPPPIPPNGGVPPMGASLAETPAPARNARDSSLTEFEEDDNAPSTAAEGRVWRPPSTVDSSVVPFYVADKNGNWVLSKSPPPAELPGDAPSASSEPKSAPPRESAQPAAWAPPRRSVSGPPAAQARVSPVLASPIRFVDSTPSTGVPSSVSSRSSSVPPPLFYHAANPRGQSGDQRGGVPHRRTDDRTASLSSGITLFENSSDESKEPTPPEEMRGSLSPVFESPRSAVAGRSPVTYPEIPGRRYSSRPVRGSGPPPPRRPPLNNQAAYSRPGGVQPGYRLPPPPGATWYDLPEEEQAVVYGGSPPTVRIVENSPPPDDRHQLPSARTKARVPPPALQLPRVRPSPSQPARNPRGSPNTGQQAPPGLHDLAPTRPSSDMSTSSSLLAKRLGNDRAAQMALAGQQQQQQQHSSSSSTGSPVRRWRRHDYTQQPGQPDWIPKLTPTRKGGDLYLNVQ